jgi:hypothetical protein
MAHRLNPIEFSHMGDNTQLENIVKEVDRRPPKDMINAQLTKNLDAKQEKFDPGRGYVDGALNYDQLEDQVPYISGNFTGWRYRKMIPVYQMCRNIKNKVDGIEAQEEEQKTDIF